MVTFRDIKRKATDDPRTGPVLLFIVSQNHKSYRKLGIAWVTVALYGVYYCIIFTLNRTLNLLNCATNEGYAHDVITFLNEWHYGNVKVPTQLGRMRV